MFDRGAVVQFYQMFRSRLTKLEEKRNLRKAKLYTLGTIGLIVLAVLVGIPVLVRVLTFVGDIKSANRPIDKNDLIPPGPPEILISYDATNSANLSVNGLAEPGTTVYLTLNSDSVGNVVTSEEGIFHMGVIQLKEGGNVLAGVAVDQAGNKSQLSRTVRISYSTRQPDLVVDTPSDGLQVSEKAWVEIKGKTDPEARLTVNDRIIIVNGTGEFLTTYNLIPGENVLTFRAVSREGNKTEREVKVTYNP